MTINQRDIVAGVCVLNWLKSNPYASTESIVRTYAKIREEVGRYAQEIEDVQKEKDRSTAEGTDGQNKESR